jgi:hypothetical protein
MYLLGCLGYLLYYLLREYKWFRNHSYNQQQIEFNISKPLTQQNFSGYIEMHTNYLQWEKLHRSPFSETNW